VFPDEALGSVDVATGHPAQREACVSLWAAWASRFAPDGLPPSRYEQVRRVLATPGVRWHTYWYDGRMQAFSAVVPLTQRTWGVLLPNPTFGPLLTWYRFRCPGPPPLEPELSQVHVVAYVAAAADAPKQVVAGLLQDIIRVIAQPGIYLVATPDPTYQAVATVLGAQPLPELTNYPYGPNNPCRYYVLDLLTTRFDQWIRERMGMRRRQG
jgi:hypothetical protein